MENGKETGTVGPGKPPVEHQFKPGHPGGPGRPAGRRGTAAVLKQLLAGVDQKDPRWEAPLAKKLIQIAFGVRDGKPFANVEQQLKAVREIKEWIEGKAAQNVSVNATMMESEVGVEEIKRIRRQYAAIAGVPEQDLEQVEEEEQGSAEAVSAGDEPTVGYGIG